MQGVALLRVLSRNSVTQLNWGHVMTITRSRAGVKTPPLRGLKQTRCNISCGTVKQCRLNPFTGPCSPARDLQASAAPFNHQHLNVNPKPVCQPVKDYSRRSPLLRNSVNHLLRSSLTGWLNHGVGRVTGAGG